MLLHDAFLQAAERLPRKTAIICGSGRLEYAELLLAATTLAGTLRSAGIMPGDRVALFLENTPEFAIGVHGVLLAGAVFVPISAGTRTDKLAFILADTHARALLTQATLAAVWAPALTQSAALRVCYVAGPTGNGHVDARVDDWPRPRELSVPAVPRIDQDLAALIYTSGSTGVPKGVMLTHLNMTSAWASVQAWLGLREDDVVALPLSPSFSYGLYNLLMALGTGASVVLDRSAAFPQRLLETLQRERATVLPGVPTLFSSLLATAEPGGFDLSSIRLVTNAAAALPVPHVQRMRQLLPDARLLLMYGLTECMRVSYLPETELEQRPDSVGRGMGNQEHWLIDSNGARLPDGASGELVVRGAHVMRGYWQRPDETAARLVPGPVAGENVLRTGDVFRTDQDGYLYFLGRTDDIIKTRGEKVAPREVESVICELVDVNDCAVVGIPDDVAGTAIKAYVRLRPGSPLTGRAIIKHCMSRLESYMAPKFVEIRDELPRTDSGKTRHASLR